MAPARRAAAGAAGAAPAATGDGVSPYDPKQARKEVVEMSISGAIAGVAAIGFTMCVIAALVTLFIIWIFPPPGTTDKATELPWTRLAPFNAAFGAS